MAFLQQTWTQRQVSLSSLETHLFSSISISHQHAGWAWGAKLVPYHHENNDKLSSVNNTLFSHFYVLNLKVLFLEPSGLRMNGSCVTLDHLLYLYLTPLPFPPNVGICSICHKSAVNIIEVNSYYTCRTVFWHILSVVLGEERLIWDPYDEQLLL